MTPPPNDEPTLLTPSATKSGAGAGAAEPPSADLTLLNPASGSGSLPATDPGTVARRPAGPDTEATLAPSVRLAPGALPQVPGYAVARELARGGMATVYLAHDPVFDREVAVKVMHPGQDVNRFVVESRVTAQLPHPGVPPVYRLGKLPDGRPFLAMKLVQGRTFAQELREADREADLPRLLGAFERICETVGFAHSKGVIHRDLKPANVMIGAFGEVQVMDWGLARGGPNEKVSSEADTKPRATLDAAAPPSELHAPYFEATMAGEVKGTPAFMAPEQARGEAVDARADVFALGGILAAILTGKAPFAGNTVDETVKRAARGELGDTFERLDERDADPELVALTKRALAPAAADRFADAKALADAVAAYRGGVEERLRAAERRRAVSAAEAREQRKRRKVQLALAAAVGLILLVGCGFAWFADRRARERDRAAEQARRGAVAAHDLATDLLKQYKYEAARGALAHAAELAAAGAPELLPDIERAQNDLALAVEVDEIRYRKWRVSPGRTEPGAGEKTDAPAEYRRAFAARGYDLAALDPAEAARRLAASELKAELVVALDDWAVYNADRDESRRLLALARELDPGPWRDRVRDRDSWKDRAAVAKLAADADPADLSPGVVCLLSSLMGECDLDPRPLLAAARARHPADFQLAFVLGRAHGLQKNYAGMVGPYEAARALRPDNSTAWNNLAAAQFYSGDQVGGRETLRGAVARNPTDHVLRCNFGMTLKDTGNLAGARAEFAEVIRLNPRYAAVYLDYGLILRHMGDEAGAIAAYRKAVELDPTFWKAWSNLGGALSDRGEWDAALAAFAEARKYESNSAEVFFNIGQTLSHKGDRLGAATAFRESVRLQPSYADAHLNLGACLLSMNDPDGALAAFREALKHRPAFAAAHYNIGSTLEKKGDGAGAVAAYREALKHNPAMKEALQSLTLCLYKSGNADATLAAAREAVKHDPSWVDGHTIAAAALTAREDFRGAAEAMRRVTKLKPDSADAHSNLGWLLFKAGDAEEAVFSLRHAVKLNPAFAPAQRNLGTVLAAGRDFAGAAAALREAVKLDPNAIDAHTNLAVALRSTGDRAGAAAVLREAVKLHPKVAKLHSDLGDTLYLIGDKPGSIAAWLEAVKLDPNLGVTQANLASEFNNSRRYADVIPHARAAIKADPNMAQVHAILGAALINTGDREGGRAALAEAARLDPKYAPLLKQFPPLPPPLPVAPPPRPLPDRAR